MAKDIKQLARVVFLWIIFAVSLYYVLQSGAQVGSAIAKQMTGGYGMYPASGYNNYCLMTPQYPSSPMSMGDSGTAQYQKDLDKYNADLKAYNDEYKARCEHDWQEQKNYNQRQELALAWSDASSSIVMLLISLLVAGLSFWAIKKEEAK